MKTYLTLLLFLSFAWVTGCSKDDEKEPDENQKAAESAYVKFTISGPEMNGDFEFNNTKDQEFKFSAIGHYEDQTLENLLGFNVSIYKSGMQFSLSAPPESGTYRNLPYFVGDKYYYLDISLDSPNGISYKGDDVTVVVSELKIVKPYVTKLKGTFSGSFGIPKQATNPADHHIEGEFEIE